MPWNIWFTPGNPSHVGKFRVLLDAFRDRGDHVHLFCVDSVLSSNDATWPQIRESGYPHVVLPSNICNPNPPLLLESLCRQRVIKAVKQTLEDYSIDAMIFATVGDFGYPAVIRATRELRIPCVYIGDGVRVPANPRYRFELLGKRRIGIHSVRNLFRMLGFGPSPGKAGFDIVLTMNEMGRNSLIRAGVDLSITHVVGSPEYDRLAETAKPRLSTEENNRIRQLLGLNNDRPIVLYVAQDFDHHRLIRDMAPAIHQCGVTLLVKFHPRMPGDLKEWRRWARDENIADEEIAFANKELTSIEAVRLCSACLTVFSTVSLEAMILRKPVVFIQYLNARLSLPYAEEYGAALDAKSPEELRSAIISVLTSQAERARLAENSRKALQNELLGPDGRSGNRTIALIDDLILRHRKRETPTQ